MHNRVSWLTILIAAVYPLCRMTRGTGRIPETISQSIIHPRLSAYMHIFGEFYYNRTPLSTPGERVVIHNRPKYRTSQASQIEPGWCIRPSMEKYRYHKSYTPKTRAEQISDTVYFPTRKFNIPKMYYKDAIIHSPQDLIGELQNPAPAIPLVTLGNIHNKALISLENIFIKLTSPAVPPRVPLEGAYPDKLQQVNQEENQI